MDDTICWNGMSREVVDCKPVRMSRSLPDRGHSRIDHVASVRVRIGLLPWEMSDL